MPRLHRRPFGSPAMWLDRPRHTEPDRPDDPGGFFRALLLGLLLSSPIWLVLGWHILAWSLS